MSFLIPFGCCFHLFFERVTKKKIDRGLPRGTIGNVWGPVSEEIKILFAQFPSYTNFKIYLGTGNPRQEIQTRP